MGRYLVVILCIASAHIASVEVMAQKVFDIHLSEGNLIEVSDLAETSIPFARCFLPDSVQATGRAVVALPGGGYQELMFKHEGYDWASFFNEQGIALIVLHYRMPGGNLNTPIADVKRTFDIIQKRAAKWGIDPSKIGVMGFSAGGHLAATICTHQEYGVSPEFQVLFYPVITMDESYTDIGSRNRFLGSSPSNKMIEAYSCEKQVSEGTPPTILFLSSDDNVVSSLNSIQFYSALLRKKVSASIHAYSSTWHGWGANKDFPFAEDVRMSLRHWLRTLDTSH